MEWLSSVGAALLRLYAVVGPVLLAALTMLYTGRPSIWFLAAAGTLALAILACDAWIIARRHWLTGGLALTTQIGFLFFVGGYAASPFPPAAALSDPLPQAFSPAGMALYVLPTGVNHRTAAFAYRGGSPWEKWDSVSNAVLIRHPQGDVLIDTGLGRTIESQLQAMPSLFRLATDLEQSQPAADRLNAAGYDSKHLRFILLTHAHWDHVSGVPDFPGVPVLVTAAEHRFIHDGGFPNAPARSIDPRRFQEYGFDGAAYLGFDESHDLYGDGSIVIVPAPGHTPGSVVVFVALPGGSRYAFVGDLVWQIKGLTQREERPWLEARVLGEDPAAVQQSMRRLSAIAARYPQITIVAAHDPGGYVSIPECSPSAVQ
jgi:glyoxylase-like metal-dependent hydrolase (beta-lactamase superfamily II)